MVKRLTIKTPNGAALKMDDTYPNEDAARTDLMRRYRIAVDRLAAYEDTGLDPEEIEQVLDAYGRGKTLRTKVAERLEIIKDIPTDQLRAMCSCSAPLTLEELREMVGQPVWIQRGTLASYDILTDFEIDGLAQFCMTTQRSENYGKTWLAYRRKPEEGAT